MQHSILATFTTHTHCESYIRHSNKASYVPRDMCGHFNEAIKNFLTPSKSKHLEHSLLNLFFWGNMHAQYIMREFCISLRSSWGEFLEFEAPAAVAEFGGKLFSSWERCTTETKHFWLPHFMLVGCCSFCAFGQTHLKIIAILRARFLSIHAHILNNLVLHQ